MHDYSHTPTFHKTPRHTIGFAYILPIGMVLGVLLFVGNFFLKGGQLSGFIDRSTGPTIQSPAAVVSTAPTRLSTPTSLPQKTAERSSIRIRVLNGSGVAGAAGKLAEEIQGLGYQDVTTGNADKYTYTDVIIRGGEDKRGAAEQLKRELEKEHTIILELSDNAPSGADIEIIIGKEE